MLSRSTVSAVESAFNTLAHTVLSNNARTLEDLVREMGEPARELTIPPQPEAPPDEAEMQKMAAIAARHGNEILGPPPGQ